MVHKPSVLRYNVFRHHMPHILQNTAMPSLPVLLHSPYAWFALGVLLVGAELLIPGVLICFFGFAAMLIAAILLVFPGIPAAPLLLLYAVLSGSLILGLRRLMPKSFSGRTTDAKTDPDDDDVVGAPATVIEAIAPGTPGKVEFRGSNWTAVSDSPLPAGARAIVTARNDLTLSVKPAE